MTPWRTLATVATPEGPLELRQRGAAEFLIVIAGRVLMTSAARRSEEALATLGLAHVKTARSPRVLVGGLGMAYTLRAALDLLPPQARVDVAELNPVVLDWCRGPLAPLTAGAASDPRVHVEIADVARLIADASQTTTKRWDAILLDLYEGPHQATQRPDDPFYGPRALARTHAALAPDGVLAVWSEEPDAAFKERLAAADFDVTVHTAGRGGRTHVIYLAARRDPRRGTSSATSPRRRSR